MFGLFSNAKADNKVVKKMDQRKIGAENNHSFISFNVAIDQFPKENFLYARKNQNIV